MRRWLIPGLLIFLIVAGSTTACGEGPEADESAAETAQGPRSRTAEAAASPVSRGDASTEIGLIGDAVIGSTGEWYLLDVMRRRVGVAAGDSIVWTGRQGHGPGEFFVPVALAAGEDVLYVLDRGSRRIERYRTDGRRLERIGGAALEFAGHDMCLSGSRLFVLGAHQGHAIHEISPDDGRVIRSFAPDPELRDPLLATYRAPGQLACAGDDILLLPQLRPEVMRFSMATGALLGSADLPGYNAARVELMGDMVAFEAMNGTHDVGASLVPLEGGRVLVQAGAVRQGSSGYEFTAIRSYVVDWRTPAARGIPERLPWITDYRDGWALAVATDPEPAAQRVRIDL